MSSSSPSANANAAVNPAFGNLDVFPTRAQKSIDTLSSMISDAMRRWKGEVEGARAAMKREAATHVAGAMFQQVCAHAAMGFAEHELNRHMADFDNSGNAQRDEHGHKTAADGMHASGTAGRGGSSTDTKRARAKAAAAAKARLAEAEVAAASETTAAAGAIEAAEGEAPEAMVKEVAGEVTKQRTAREAVERMAAEAAEMAAAKVAATERATMAAAVRVAAQAEREEEKAQAASAASVAEAAEMAAAACVSSGGQAFAEEDDTGFDGDNEWFTTTSTRAKQKQTQGGGGLGQGHGQATRMSRDRGGVIGRGASHHGHGGQSSCHERPYDTNKFPTSNRPSSNKKVTAATKAAAAAELRLMEAEAAAPRAAASNNNEDAVKLNATRIMKDDVRLNSHRLTKGVGNNIGTNAPAPGNPTLRNAANTDNNMDAVHTNPDANVNANANANAIAYAHAYANASTNAAATRYEVAATAAATAAPIVAHAGPAPAQFSDVGVNDAAALREVLRISRLEAIAIAAAAAAKRAAQVAVAAAAEASARAAEAEAAVAAARAAHNGETFTYVCPASASSAAVNPPKSFTHPALPRGLDPTCGGACPSSTSTATPAGRGGGRGPGLRQGVAHYGQLVRAGGARGGARSGGATTPQSPLNSLVHDSADELYNYNGVDSSGSGLSDHEYVRPVHHGKGRGDGSGGGGGKSSHLTKAERDAGNCASAAAAAAKRWKPAVTAAATAHSASEATGSVFGSLAAQLRRTIGTSQAAVAPTHSTATATKNTETELTAAIPPSASFSSSFISATAAAAAEGRKQVKISGESAKDSQARLAEFPSLETAVAPSRVVSRVLAAAKRSRAWGGFGSLKAATSLPPKSSTSHHSSVESTDVCSKSVTINERRKLSALAEGYIPGG
jgi:hypothetical protein